MYVVWSSCEKNRSIKVGFWLGLVCAGLWLHWNKKASWVVARNSEAQWLGKCGVDRLSQFIVGTLKSPSISNFPPIKEVFRINLPRTLLFSDELFGELYKHKICKEVLSLISILQQAWKKETLAQVFSCEFCEVSIITFFTEHPWTTTSHPY